MLFTPEYFFFVLLSIICFQKIFIYLCGCAGLQSAQGTFDLYSCSMQALFLKFLFIQLVSYFWLGWVFTTVSGLSLVVASGSYSFSCSAQASHCCDFSCYGTQVMEPTQISLPSTNQATSLPNSQGYHAYLHYKPYLEIYSF